jgi:hypothetical protein
VALHSFEIALIIAPGENRWGALRHIVAAETKGRIGTPGQKP